MFDLDGTLLRFVQDDFIRVYFGEISKVFIKLGLNADAAVKAVWVGTKAMTENDGSVPNEQRFWDAFSAFVDVKGARLKAVEDACDNFYSNEFNIVKSVLHLCDIPTKLVRAMAAKGYNVVLATNPLFPPCAVESRLAWIGLTAEDFKLITNYKNSTFCKPNLDYYREVFKKINKSPQQCLMVGNSPFEDMCVSELGSEIFLVTDFMENETGMEITGFPRGTIEELESMLMAMPDITG